MAGDDNNDTIVAQEGNSATTIINKVAVKVPPFWTENPNIWFTQVEAQFSLSGITVDQTKFDTVVAAMETKILNQVSDAVENPPVTGKYDNLKKKLLHLFGTTEAQKIRKLLSDLEIGDRRPSQLLNEMRRLGGQNVNEQLLENLWIDRLPAQVRAVLQVSDADLNGKAALADKIIEVTGQNTIAQASAMPSLQEQIYEISNKLDRLWKDRRDRSRSRSRSRFSGRRGGSRSSSRNSGNCYFHRRFGDKAWRCEQPCTFKPSKEQQKN